MKPLDKNCLYVKIAGPICDKCPQREECLKSLGNPDDMNFEKCPECGTPEKGFFYDHERNETVCTICGLVICEGMLPVQPAFFKNARLGNPSADKKVLKLLRRQRKKFRRLKRKRRRK